MVGKDIGSDKNNGLNIVTSLIFIHIYEYNLLTVLVGYRSLFITN